MRSIVWTILAIYYIAGGGAWLKVMHHAHVVNGWPWLILAAVTLVAALVPVAIVNIEGGLPARTK
jgi:hypothetical protein